MKLKENEVALVFADKDDSIHLTFLNLDNEKEVPLRGEVLAAALYWKVLKDPEFGREIIREFLATDDLLLEEVEELVQ